MVPRTKPEPLLKLHVLHAIEERIRVGCRALAYLADHNDEIVEGIRAIVGVHGVHITNITANLVIMYNRQVTEQGKLLEAV